MVTGFGQKKNKTTASAAFTLVEIVVGIGLMGIMMATLFAGLASGFGIVNTARQDLRATQILTQKTEAVRLCTWSELNGLPSTFQDYYYTSGSTNSAPNVTYYGTISVGPASCISSSASYYSKIELVTISLVWTNYLSSHPIVHNRSMQTLVSYNGLVNYIYGSDFVQQ
jgi:type II secretory pathway pseudopilin PulG